MRPLISALILLVLMIYVVGVFFTQAVSTHLADNMDAVPDEALLSNYGSLAQSLFSLFQAILGGMDWGDMANPLVTHIGSTYGIIFACYICFAVLAMMNVMTGVFVEAALGIAKADEEVYMVNHMKELLKVTDADQSGSISWEEFEEQLENPSMVEYFKCIDVDCSEGRSLFDILDPDGEGQVSSDVFVSGCLRLRGPARAMDLEILSNMTRKASTKMVKLLHRLEKLCMHVATQATSRSKPAQPRMQPTVIQSRPVWAAQSPPAPMIMAERGATPTTHSPVLLMDPYELTHGEYV
jgi:Ca2+-binding EF-hand superfamily protein